MKSRILLPFIFNLFIFSIIEGNTNFESKEIFADSLSYYMKFLERSSIEPKWNRSLLKAARLAREMGRDSIALEFLKRVKEGKEVEDAWYMMAQIYFDRELYNEAESKLLGLIGWAQTKETIYNAVCLLAKIYVTKGNLNMALSYIKGLLQDPDVPSNCLDEARYLYEWIRYLKGYYPSPLKLNESFSDLYPESPRSPKLLFEVFLYYSNKHKKEAAVSIFNKMVSRYPNDSLTFKALTGLHSILSKDEEYGVWEKYLERKALDSLAFKAFFTLAEWAEERGDLDYALEYYERASQSVDYKRVALFRMAKILKKIKKEDEAIVLFERLYDENPDDTLGFLSLFERIVLLKSLGRSKKADSLFSVGEKKLEGDRLVELLLLMGKLAFEEGDLNKTELYLKKALEFCESEEKREKVRAFMRSFLKDK